jgi:hypothetical protein
MGYVRIRRNSVYVYLVLEVPRHYGELDKKVSEAYTIRSLKRDIHVVSEE